MGAVMYSRPHEPPPNCTRWTPGRKAWLLHEIEAGRLSREQAAELCAAEPGELVSWADRYRDHGLKGLAVTKIQAVDRRPTYRRLPASQGRAGR